MKAVQVMVLIIGLTFTYHDCYGQGCCGFCLEYGPDTRVCETIQASACSGSRCDSPSSPCFNNPNPDFLLNGDDYWLMKPGLRAANPEEFGLDIVTTNVHECSKSGTCHCSEGEDGRLRCYIDPATIEVTFGYSHVLGGDFCFLWAWWLQ